MLAAQRVESTWGEIRVFGIRRRLQCCFAHLIVASALTLATLSIASADSSEPNTDRPGGDYKNFEIKNPDECREACLHDAPPCKAFVKRGIQGSSARRGRADLPADLHRHLGQGELCQAL
jgi:hypothetical protein